MVSLATSVRGGRRKEVSVMSANRAADLDDQMRVLVAIEPRSYRTSVGRALQTLRPLVAVRVVEPEELMAEITRFEPALVISGRPRPAGCRLDWMEFHPYDEAPATVCIDGCCLRLHQPGLGDLLSMVDEVERRALPRCRR
jgi:hypothetical protein